MSYPRQLLLMSLSVVSCCCEGDMCPEDEPMMGASDSSVPPTSTGGSETETVEPETDTDGSTATTTD
ncbi:MAG: hypothetical protein ACPG77_17330, partial [Nannocystaceae bacterium]